MNEHSSSIHPQSEMRCSDGVSVEQVLQAALKNMVRMRTDEGRAMAADLEASRQLAESSSAQLTAANQSIEERRRELETIVETIPSGVVTLDGSGTVLKSNRAFAALMGLREDASLAGEKIEAR